MKPILLTKRVMITVTSLFASISILQANTTQENPKLTNPFDNKSTSINGSYSYDDFSMKATTAQTSLLIKGGSFKSSTVSMSNTQTTAGCELKLQEGSLVIGTINMSSSYAGSNTDTLLAIQGGNAHIDMIHLGKNGDAGRSFLEITGGTTYLGGVKGSETSDLMIGNFDAPQSCHVTIGGTISVGEITVAKDLTSFSLSHNLLAASSNGAVKVFDYQHISAAGGYVDFNYEGTNIMVPDSISNIYDMLTAAIDAYKGTDYDLSEAKVVIEFSENDPYHTGAGSVSIVGIKPIPEPSSALLGLLGFGVLVLRRNRN